MLTRGIAALGDEPRPRLNRQTDPIATGWQSALIDSRPVAMVCIEQYATARTHKALRAFLRTDGVSATLDAIFVPTSGVGFALFEPNKCIPDRLSPSTVEL